MKIEDVSYYIINKSLQLSSINQDTNYLVDFEKLVYLLLLIEIEYIKINNTNLFSEDFIVSSRKLKIGNQIGCNFDFEYNEFLKNKLFIFINMYNNYYTTPTFKVNVEKEIESIIDKVMIEYDCFSTNELKNILFEKFELQDLRGYKSLTRIK